MLTYNTAKTLFRINLTFGAVGFLAGLAWVWGTESGLGGDTAATFGAIMRAAVVVQWVTCSVQWLDLKWARRGDK